MREIDKKFKSVWEYDEQNRRDASDDLSFRAGTQWDDQDARIRKIQNRPTLVLSQIDQYVRNIVGQSRSMSPSIRVFSGDANTDPRMAALFEGAIRDIEQRSNAKAARINAHTDQVTCGIGHYEVCYRLHPTLPHKEIYVKTIKDPLSIIWDPSSTEIDRSDARFCFRIREVPLMEFEQKFPKARRSNFNASKVHGYSYRYYDNLRWEHGEYVRLAQYWEKYTKKHEFITTVNGEMMEVTGMEREEIATYQPRESYKRDIDHLRFQLLSGDDILEEITDYPCRYIPIIPVVGEEVATNDGLYRQGIVRKMREPQKFYNYMMSIGMEQLSQSVKSPFLVTNEMIKYNEADWRNAYTNSKPFLAYQPDQFAPGAKPERILPPTQHRDTLQVAQMFMGDMSNAAGLHEDSLGKETNAKSGKAIEARQRGGIIATNVFGDNLGYSIRHEGRILLSMIQNIYTENRRIRVISAEEKEAFVDINKAGLMNNGRDRIIVNDMTRGEFEVRAEAGPSFGAVKQESLQALMQLVQLNPQMMPFIIPEIVKMMEVPNQESLQKAVQDYQNAVMGVQGQQQVDSQGQTQQIEQQPIQGSTIIQ